MTKGTWHRTLHGQDVYTEDAASGWYWHDSSQAWLHTPHLILEPSTSRASRHVRDVTSRLTHRQVRSEAYRLTHGWPPLLKAFMPGNGVRGISAVFCWGYRLAFLYLWAVVIFGWGIHHVVRSWQRFWYGVYKGSTPYEEVWYTEQPQDARNVLGVMFIVMLSLALWYLLYMNLCYTVDSHKGNLMFGGLMAHAAWTTHKRHARERDHRLAQDVAAELDRRHHWRYR